MSASQDRIIMRRNPLFKSVSLISHYPRSYLLFLRLANGKDAFIGCIEQNICSRQFVVGTYPGGGPFSILRMSEQDALHDALDILDEQIHM